MVNVAGLSRIPQLVAPNGFGDGQNAYAHSMAWFSDRLYVGTTRNNLCMIRTNPKRDTLRQWPVRTPEDIYDLDMRAQIWCLNPASGESRRVHVSSTEPGRSGRNVPRDVGYRAMVVFHSASDEAPALYTCTTSWSESAGAARILRSVDGDSFESLPCPIAEGATSFRALLAFRGRLFTAPAGEGTSFYRARSPVLLCSTDPARGWEMAAEPGFGDRSNTAIVELAEFNRHLYAGTLNPRHGLQVWKTRGDGAPPFKWKKVMDRGAGRGNLNEGVLALCSFRGALYVGTHISMGGHDRRHHVGPAGPELLRLHADDSWELVVGETRPGLRPLSGLGPGFGNPFVGYIWTIRADDGELFVGTFDSAVFMRYADLDLRPQSRLAVQRHGGVEAIIDREGGFDLWCSADGDQWHAVTRTGFANPYNYGARTLVSCQHGLFVGTANPFGPEVATEVAPGRWHYVDNRRGGLEVWRLSIQVPDQPEVNMPTELAHSNGHSELNARYDSAMFEDMMERFYGGSDFANWGYWDSDTQTQREACENLMEELLALFPSLTGTILDVACGKGATTKYLLRYFTPDSVTGINISPKQLERAGENAPGVRLLLMDATDLNFSDGSFDNVICVEAAFHFDTRENFLREALRVLRPGGWLVLSDILMTEVAHELTVGLHAANWVPDIDEYEEVFWAAGFTDVEVVNATEECWWGHIRHRTVYASALLQANDISRRRAAGLMARNWRQLWGVKSYLLVRARKPDV